MKNKIRMDFVEQTVLLTSGVKWIILAIFAGLVVGSVTGIFLKLLHLGEHHAVKWDYYYLLMPIAFFLSSLLVVKLAPDAEGHGTEKVIEAVHQKQGKIDIKVIPVKLLATLITLVSGGSAGKEGPCAQIGAGTASFFSDLFKIKDTLDRKRFVICGISAGFAGVFGTPIAGAVFAAEVLYVGRFSYIVLLPSLIASYVSCMVNKVLGVSHLHYMIQLNDINNIKMFLNMLLFGAFMGSLAMLFIRILNFTEEAIHKINIYKPFKGIIGGLILVFIVYVTGSKDYIGLGSNVINESVSGQSVGSLDFLLKMFTTSVTLGSGGSGGILTPIFYIGATAGNAWGQMMHGNIALFSAVGMVAFVAACANTPIAGILIAMELFGVEVASYASIAIVIGYLMVGHKSVYPSQILVINKSPSMDTEINCEIGHVQEEPHIKIKNKNKFLGKLYDHNKGA
ncbi:chloride channel protein [Crassaminicella profunda]|uniref:chloride channel protein n=1 Tax=Crassaminicella profunda TaxID=1286698 RepID=UPI001CA71FE1|nr:chloride channel protein [Crassaminicella profunda]QZY54839.1 chloride channel protein [Crassaminicella profunda]